jgi:tetratricopeptide (TPR) repeat protein
VSPKLEDRKLSVETVVEALTSPLVGRSERETCLADQVERAASDLDSGSAMQCARTLVDCVYEESPSPGQLEALVVLGLAHPRVFRKHGLSLSDEGRRLALLLEGSGRPERAGDLLEYLLQIFPEDREVQQDLASFMRRTGGVEEFIERCMQRAESEATRGNYLEAISCLQEVLLHDQGRRDVARMIRDLRYAEMEARNHKRHRQRVAAGVLAAIALVVVSSVREVQIHRQYQELPAASENDAPSIRTRLAKVEGMIDRHKLWAGLFRAAEERAQLQTQLDQLDARAAEKHREQLREQQQRLASAAAARTRGLNAIDRGDMAAALEEFKKAMALTDEAWEHRERVSADIHAIERWMRERPGR